MVIVGSGMVGCALAATAGNSKFFENKSILLLDSTRPKIWERDAPLEFDIRVSAISPGSISVMERAGVWDSIKQFRPPQHVKQLRVWDACSSSSIHFDRPDFDEDVAYIVENTAILTGLWKKLQELKNVEVLTDGGLVKRCFLWNSNSDVRCNTIELENGKRINAKLLIGADGFDSCVKKAMNVHELKWNYDQKAIVATLQIENTGNENAVAWQRFTPNGPVAILPLNMATSSLVWSTTTPEADRLVKLTPDEFVNELNDALFSTDEESRFVNQILASMPIMGSDYSQYPPTIVALKSQLATFPLGFQHATNYVKAGAALIGDAAHRIHPLAGQGVNLGFGDVACFVEELEQGMGCGEELGSLSVLRQYETRRQWHNLSVMMTVDGLNRLYSTSFSPAVLVRSLGLNTVNNLRFFKDFFMKRAAA